MADGVTIVTVPSQHCSYIQSAVCDFARRRNWDNQLCHACQNNHSTERPKAIRKKQNHRGVTEALYTALSQARTKNYRWWTHSTTRANSVVWSLVLP
ncbi:hypothetical protein J6590_010761 [Homalodisca vitripennis]|nr:hypothetical protein J6590_010761 [Homalodisca vitripennis]